MDQETDSASPDGTPPMPSFAHHDSCGECRMPQGTAHLDGCTGQFYETAVTEYTPARD